MSTHTVAIGEATKTPQFYLLWVVLCLNVTAGIGVLGVARDLMQDLFGTALPTVVTGTFATTFVLMISVFNMLGRFFWAMMDRGVYLPCSQFEAAFLMTAFTEEHIDATIQACREAIAEIA